MRAQCMSGTAGAQDRVVVLILEPGDELHAAVGAVARELAIEGGFVNGIGAVDQIELGYFRLPEKVYDRRLVRERVEVVALNGNLGRRDGEPFLHAHGVFAGADFAAFGGHVFRAVASITVEILIIETGRLARGAYPEFGLTRILTDGCGG